MVNNSTNTNKVLTLYIISSVIDRGFQSWSGQARNYNIGICSFSAKHSALRSKNKD
jgi:hypothetical protein